MSDIDRLDEAVSECREMIREAHAATKDLRAAVREAKKELSSTAKDEVTAQIQLEVSRQLEELGERTSEAVSAATQKVIAEFDRFGESLLGKETYWQKASGRRAAQRPDTDVVSLDVQPSDANGLAAGTTNDYPTWTSCSRCCPASARRHGPAPGWRSRSDTVTAVAARHHLRASSNQAVRAGRPGRPSTCSTNWHPVLPWSSER